VRLIVDGIGSSTWVSSIRQRAALAGIQLKVFHELPWQRWWQGRDQSEAPQSLARLLQKLNNRNHRKVCIIDERRAFVGSMNVIEYHLASCVGDTAWRDTGVYLEGREAAVLVSSFNELWHNERRGFRLRRRKRSAHSGDLILLNVRRSQRSENYLDLLVRMLSAKERIWIENAYFVPDASLIRVLGVAAGSGVDVKVLVPAFSDVVFIPWVASAFHLGLLRAGVRVFEYTKCVLHAKTMVIDEWGLVGSSNLNHRSLLHDLEADAVLVDAESCRSLQQQFELDCAHGQEVTLENWRRRPLLERVIGRLLLAVRRVL
jgi:cardiolipin synthase